MATRPDPHGAAAKPAGCGRDRGCHFLTRADSLARAFTATVRTDVRLRVQFDAYYAAGRALTARLRAGEVGDRVAGAVGDFHGRYTVLRAALDAAARNDRGAMARGFAAERVRQRAAWTASLLITLAFVVAVVALARVTTHDLAHRAYHDPLTGLANRARFQERIAEALAGTATPAGAGRREDGAAVAVLLIDLDGFKLVNDTAGHAVGDVLLQVVAERLLNATRGSDLVARLGGDEFAVLLTNVRGDVDATVVAERIVVALGRPVPVHGTTVVVGTSVGIARGGHNTPTRAGGEAGGDGLAPGDALLRDADLALYQAKAHGRGQYVMFEPGMHAAVVERLELEGALRRGLEREEFCVEYQPIIDLASGTLSGVEALVRWQHPTRGRVSPAEFIPLAEETGLIIPLGRWVLEEACRQGAAWAARADGAEGAAFSISVNVSGRQLGRPEFVGEVEAALEASGLDPARLTLELTESTIITHPEIARTRLIDLKVLGVRLAIDDFGTGYSALSYLRQFPIDVLKIDKSFVDPIAGAGRPVALAAAIVALGDALGLRTVAEGVESAAQAEALARMGCPLAQGFHFSRPVTPAALTAWLDARADVSAPADPPCVVPWADDIPRGPVLV